MLAPTPIRELDLPDAAATRKLGALLAKAARPRDAIALEGDLGMGKTEFARGFIHARAGAEVEVPSPTFTLVQTYETPRLTVAHYDLYRLKSSRELNELGFAEALEDGAVLVEWPERAPEYLPDETLHLRLKLEEDSRRVKLTGPIRWAGLA